MNEITTVILENEMDLILAHKQAMRIAELAGLSLSAQTSFTTAVSEVSRCLIGRENQAKLGLYLSSKSGSKYLHAILESELMPDARQIKEGVQHARRLIRTVQFTERGKGCRTEMEVALAPSFTITPGLTEDWKILLNNDPFVSPYEEIKRKNRQLTELSEKLRQSEQQYKLLADSLPIMIYTFTGEGRLTYANKWLLDYTGLSVEEMNNTRFRNVYHPDDFDTIWEGWDQDHRDKLIGKERKLRHKSGEYRWHTGVSIPISNETGEIQHWNAYMVDIHAQKTIEETLKNNYELQKTQKELEEKIELLNRSNKLLEQFAFVASHDLQEPLRKISFFSNYIKTNFGNQLGDKGTQYLDKLVNETARTREIVHDILHYSTLSRDKDHFESLDLNAVLDAVMSDMEIILAEKQASVSYSGLPVLPGNKIQLMQLFSNLLSNAVKFTGSDTRPKISVSARYTDKSTIIYVQDNGIGIDKQFHGKVFELFQRLHPKDEFYGTGIGLSTCRKIMELHDGDIGIESDGQNGSTFVLTFPNRAL